MQTMAKMANLRRNKDQSRLNVTDLDPGEGDQDHAGEAAVEAEVEVIGSGGDIPDAPDPVVLE